MSRIAKYPVVIPTGVDVKLNGQAIAVKGPKGELNYVAHSAVRMQIEDDEGGESGGSAGAKMISFKARDGSTLARMNAGTTRALVNNMVTGVSQGFERQLELVGVGYRAQLKGDSINLTLGLSHPVEYKLPSGVKAATPNQTTVVLSSVDKQLLGQVAADIRAFRPPEPYKGKGIRYANERIVRKETKKK